MQDLGNETFIMITVNVEKLYRLLLYFQYRVAHQLTDLVVFDLHAPANSPILQIWQNYHTSSVSCRNIQK